MKLLLDEHLSGKIARGLRDRGHDVAAASEDKRLSSQPDPTLFAVATSQARAVVTRDFAGFCPLVAEAMARGAQVYGVVCVPYSFPQGEASFGRIIDALDALLTAHPAEDALAEIGEVWLEEA